MSNKNLDDASARFALLELDYDYPPIGYGSPPAIAVSAPATPTKPSWPWLATLGASIGSTAIPRGRMGLVLSVLGSALGQLPRPVRAFTPDPFEACTAQALGAAVYHAARGPVRSIDLGGLIPLARVLWICRGAVGHAMIRLSRALQHAAQVRVAQAPTGIAGVSSLADLAALESQGSGQVLLCEGSGTARGFGWTAGKGDSLPWGFLAELAERYAVPAPAVPDAQVHFAAALRRQSRSTRVARRGSGDQYRIGAVTSEADVGTALARTQATVWLGAGDLIEATPDSDPGIVHEIRAEYIRRRSAQIVSATDITTWLTGVMSGTFRAAQYYAGWCVTDTQLFGRAIGLCTDLKRAGFGRLDRWGIGIELTTAGGLLDSIADCYSHRVETLRRHYVQQTEAARKRGNVAIGARMATTIMGSLSEVIESAKTYARILGPERVEHVYRAARELYSDIEPLVSDTAQRGALLELE